MHTPDDITDPNPPEDDQPYAGVLYVDSLLYARKERWTHAWELKLGVVGPASQAENVQKDFHELVGGDEPMGWDTQLPNEPVINVGYTVAHLAAPGGGRIGGVETRSRGHVAWATYFTGAGLGVYGEVGWNLVDALGGTALRRGSMQHRPSVSGPWMAGPCRSSAGSEGMAWRTTCRSTARCSMTAAQSTRSPSSAPAHSASPSGMADSL